MDATTKFELDMTINLNKTSGLLRFICLVCHKTYDCYNIMCICGNYVHPQSCIPIYRDCGCTFSLYSRIGFTLQNIKYCKITDIVKNYNLQPFMDESRFLYIKLGSKTNLNCVLKDCQIYAHDTSYTLLIPNENNNMRINDIPCKLYYTELTKSSYKGYFFTYVIVLNYDIIYNLMRFHKLLRRIYCDKRSLFSKVPKELIFLIKYYSNTILHINKK
jgi:hypothetical protein